MRTKTAVDSVDNKSVLIGAYAAMLAISNIAAVKLLSFSGWEFTAGVFPIAIAYLISDIGVEKHGKEFGHNLVWSGVFSLLFVVFVSQFVVWLPGESTVNAVLGSSLPILTASIITILVAQHTDVWLFAMIREKLPYRATRNVGSTVISQLLDTTLFSLLAFAILPPVLGGNTLPLSVITTIVFTEWVIKSGLAIIDTPAFLIATDES